MQEVIAFLACVQSPKPLKSLGSGKKTLNLGLEDEIICYIISRLFRHAYFRAMLILWCHSFGIIKKTIFLQCPFRRIAYAYLCH